MWLHVDTDVNSDVHIVDLYIHKPVASDIYYDTKINVNWYNRRRCDNLKLEKNLSNHSLEKRVNLSIFGISVFDT